MTDPQREEREAVVRWHHDKDRRCITCWEHGAPFDGGCQWCGYADARWTKQMPGEAHLWSGDHLTPTKEEE